MMTRVKNLAVILRLHIVMIAVMGTLVFGWLTTGRYLPLIALIVGLDWLLVNLLNRISDVEEDRANQIPGTAQVGSHPWRVWLAFVLVFGITLWLTARYLPQLTGWRLFMQATGIVYSFRVLPGANGRVRLKDVYFLKNFMSALGFVTTCFFYPLALAGYQPVIGWAATLALIFYFVPFELTYEIFYDLRDVTGDRAQGVPTYPVVHGAATARAIIYALLAASVALLSLALLTGVVGIREWLMAAGPIVQFVVLRRMFRAGPTIQDCIRLTNLGWLMLGGYLLCTAAWLGAGLPANVFL